MIDSAPLPFALFDNNLDGPEHAGAWLLTGLREEVCCIAPSTWAADLCRLEDAARSGAWVVLAASYELGYALEARLLPLLPVDHGPLLRGWIFDHGEWLDDDACDRWLAAQAGTDVGGVARLDPELPADDYLAAVERIRRYITTGDCYQVNFTFTFASQCFGSLAALYRKLRAAQPVRHGAFVVHHDGAVLSRSPELFLTRQGQTLVSQPMKGTASREGSAQSLSSSPKDRAENVMIVDLIRNDMGRLAPPGGVRVSDLCKVEAYPTVWQMTSRITAEPVSADLASIFRALFPCGSITGAPRIRAMEIIRELEATPRGLYCGALGLIRPGGDFSFSVPIRSLMVDAGGKARLGVGSGVVHDSAPAAEWAECQLKAGFLTGMPKDLRLIETLRYEPRGGYPYLAEHLERLRDSAACFGFPLDEGELRHLLGSVSAAEALRVRVTLGQGGDLEVDTLKLSAGAPAFAPTVVMSPCRTRSGDLLLRHKTTARAVYDRELARVMRDGHFDALFMNEKGELTEGARSNLFIQRGQMLHTPPLTAGVLNGVLRRRLLAEGKACETPLFPADLASAEAVFVGNGLRGLLPVQVLRDETEPLPDSP